MQFRANTRTGLVVATVVCSLSLVLIFIFNPILLRFIPRPSGSECNSHRRVGKTEFCTTSDTYRKIVLADAALIEKSFQQVLDEPPQESRIIINLTDTPQQHFVQLQPNSFDELYSLGVTKDQNNLIIQLRLEDSVFQSEQPSWLVSRLVLLALYSVQNNMDRSGNTLERLDQRLYEYYFNNLDELPFRLEQ